jgi:hypothetical protein
VTLLQPVPSPADANVTNGVWSHAELIAKAFQGGLRVGPDVVHGGSGERGSFVAALDLGGAVLVPVHLILRLCTPSQILRSIILGVSVKVAALHTRRTRPVERFADHVRPEFENLAPVVFDERNAHVSFGHRVAGKDSRPAPERTDHGAIGSELVHGETRYGSDLHEGIVGTPNSRVVLRSTKGATMFWKTETKRRDSVGDWLKYSICTACGLLRMHNTCHVQKDAICPRCGEVGSAVATVGRIRYKERYVRGKYVNVWQTVPDSITHEEHEGAQRSRMAKAIEDDGN